MVRKSISLLVLFCGLATSGFAWADRDRHFHDDDRVRGSVHFYFGPPGFSPWYYGPPYYAPYYHPYYPPPLIVVPATPPVYIERGDEPGASPLAPGYWYYCAKPKGYYPYVKQCPGGWQQVAPQPPSQP